MSDEEFGTLLKLILDAKWSGKVVFEQIFMHQAEGTKVITDTSQFMLDHMEFHLNTPFCYDAEGRMRTINEPE
ncbi:MAG: hypothetical protein R2867_32240 [Caldilineaceae bacterium]